MNGSTRTAVPFSEPFAFSHYQLGNPVEMDAMPDILRFLASRLAFLSSAQDERRAAAAQAALEAASQPAPDLRIAK